MYLKEGKEENEQEESGNSMKKRGKGRK